MIDKIKFILCTIIIHIGFSEKILLLFLDVILLIFSDIVFILFYLSFVRLRLLVKLIQNLFILGHFPTI